MGVVRAGDDAGRSRRSAGSRRAEQGGDEVTEWKIETPLALARRQYASDVLLVRRRTEAAIQCSGGPVWQQQCADELAEAWQALRNSQTVLRDMEFASATALNTAQKGPSHE